MFTFIQREVSVCVCVCSLPQIMVSDEAAMKSRWWKRHPPPVSRDVSRLIMKWGEEGAQNHWFLLNSKKKNWQLSKEVEIEVYFCFVFFTKFSHWFQTWPTCYGTEKPKRIQGIYAPCTLENNLGLLSWIGKEHQERSYYRRVSFHFKEEIGLPEFSALAHRDPSYNISESGSCL